MDRDLTSLSMTSECPMVPAIITVSRGEGSEYAGPVKLAVPVVEYWRGSQQSLRDGPAEVLTWVLFMLLTGL
jgi:hypothetical protein